MFITHQKYPNIVPNNTIIILAGKIAEGSFANSAIPPDKASTPEPTKFFAIDAISDGILAADSNPRRKKKQKRKFSL